MITEGGGGSFGDCYLIMNSLNILDPSPSRASVCLCCSSLYHEHFKWMGWFLTLVMASAGSVRKRVFSRPCLFFHKHFLVKVGLATVYSCALRSRWWPQPRPNPGHRLPARSVAGLAPWPPASVSLFHLQMGVVCSSSGSNVSFQKKKKKKKFLGRTWRGEARGRSGVLVLFPEE